ncbi:MAG: DUF3488 and transglutaminase-like domain-containing protein [Neisseria sp.]|nr:DUF3488 and transglutaminase-like domain-containing protein [Neisseria sp.]
MKTLRAEFTDLPAPIFAQYAAMVVLAVIALPLLWQLSTVVTAMFVLLWCVRLAMVKFGIAPLKTVALLVLLLLCGAVVLTQLKSLWGRDGGVAFLLMMALLKSFESRRIRDWQVLLLSALFLTVGSLLFSQGIVNAAWAVFCLFAVLFCLNLLDGGHWRGAWRQAARGMAFSLLPAMVLFIAVPRLPEPLIRLLPTPSEQAKSGLSDTMQASTFSEMVLSDELAFNAVFADGFVPQNNQLYWRTLIMPDFDGHTWRQQSPIQRVSPDDHPLRQHAKVRYELILKDWKGHIPALDYPIETDRHAWLFSTRTVMAKRSYAQLRRVEITSALSDRLPDRLYAHERRRYLALPPQRNPRTVMLAQNLRRQSANDEAFARRSLAYFAEQGFSYTLNPPRMADETHEVDTFMFDAQQGFCGHYASAYVVMMRAAGLPARVVTGYQGGEYNADAQFWQVRSKDAHAWAEVWLEERQSWLRIDPTAVISARSESGIEAALPAGESLGGSRIPLWAKRFAAESQFYWQKWVVDFDAGRQNALFKKLGLGKVSVSSVLTILVLGGALALLPMFAWWRVHLRRQSHPLSDGFMLLKRRLISDEEMLTALGPQDLLAHLRLSGSLNPALQSLIEEYIALRYRTDDPPKHAVWAWYRRAKKYRPTGGEQ